MLEERKEERDIKTFKNIIYNMVNEMDDFDKLREGIRKYVRYSSQIIFQINKIWN